MRVNRSISSKERRRYALDNLGGVDFTSSPLLCAPNRSPEAVNWIGDHGINRKRHGWEQVMDTFVGHNIHCIQQVNDTTVIVHVFNELWKIVKEDEKWEKSKISITSDASLVNSRSQVFLAMGKVFLVTSNDILVVDIHSNTATSIANTAYIPTTTINIDAKGSEDIRATQDLVNLLTARRKNTLVGSASGSTWKLDGQVSSAFQTVLRYNGAEYKTIKEADNSYAEGLFLKGSTSDTAAFRLDYVKGEITSNIDTLSIDEKANIEVEFTAYNTQKNHETNLAMIRGCTFGTLFGVGGAQDRLFLSGNSAFPNMVFFSEANDFTYFPDTYTATFGTSGTPVKGFLRLSDSVLAVLKEDGVYYQSGEYRTEYDDAGNIKKITPVFSITAGSINESAVNPYAVANFGGDNVFLSHNGVFAIEPTSNVLTNTRTARERSYPIAARMPEFDAANAVMFTHGQRLYLSDGEACYVADSAYKYTPTGSESYSYEWWYWDHIPARVFAEVNGELWFGTADGRVCRFTDGYVDKIYTTTKSGMIGINYNGKAFTYGKDLEKIINVGGIIRFETDEVYAIYAPIERIDGAHVFIDHDFIFRCFEGDKIEYTSGEEVKQCVVAEVNAAEYWITLKETATADNYITLNGDENLVINISHKRLRIVGKNDIYPEDINGDGEMTEADNNFRVDQENALNETWDYMPINVKSPENVIATIWTNTPVVADWVSPPLDFGNDSLAKTLFSMTVTAETGKNSVLSFGYETRKRAEEMVAAGLSVFSFEDMSFLSFSFENGFQTSYTVRARDRNFNFLRFRFRSDGDRACAVHRISALYKINKYNKGVM